MISSKFKMYWTLAALIILSACGGGNGRNPDLDFTYQGLSYIDGSGFDLADQATPVTELPTMGKVDYSGQYSAEHPNLGTTRGDTILSIDFESRNVSLKPQTGALGGYRIAGTLAGSVIRDKPAASPEFEDFVLTGQLYRTDGSLAAGEFSVFNQGAVVEGQYIATAP